jgi:hypothetical protein
MPIEKNYIHMKTAAIIVTAIATVIFLFTSYQLTYDPIGRSTKDGILLFNFMIWYAIPGILWIIYLVTKKK